MRERREYDAQIDAYESRIEANRHGRHARTQPRAELPPVTPPPRQPDRSALVRSGYADTWRGMYGGPAALPSGGAIAHMLNQQQRHASATIIDPVELPPPAPATDLHGAADTGLLPSLASLSDTGAFQAITDWGDQMQVAIETGTL
jgi:hypothetical protein